MMRIDAKQQGEESMEARLRREAAEYQPRVGRELEMRLHRALVEEKVRGSAALPRQTAPWRLVALTLGVGLAGLVFSLAVLKPWQVAPTTKGIGDTPVAVQPTPGPSMPTGSLAEVGELVQSPLNQEMNALQNDARRMVRTMVWFDAAAEEPTTRATTGG